MNIYCANWKMNMSAGKVLEWIEGFTKTAHTLKDNERVVIFPSYPHIPLVIEAFKSMPHVVVGGQNISSEAAGNFTGQVSAAQLLELGNAVLLGHSELHEDPQTTWEKYSTVMQTKALKIVCFRDARELQRYTTGTITENSYFAWEDPQNISQGGIYKSPDLSDIGHKITEIKEKYPKLPILYGGSVNRDNMAYLRTIPGLEGVLVGNASLDPKHFTDIINS